VIGAFAGSELTDRLFTRASLIDPIADIQLDEIEVKG